MSFSPGNQNETPQLTENIQEYYSAILEYYDELFPLTSESLNFFLRRHTELQEASAQKPAPFTRLLGIGCATGTLENKLNSFGLDITGIDKNPDMVATARRRIKRSSSTIRFFEMSTLDMRRFLKADSFNIISCLENMLPYLSDETLQRKFFHDCHSLLRNSGILVIQVLNYDQLIKSRTTVLPSRSSVRVNLTRVYQYRDDGLIDLDTTLELGNGSKIRSNRNVQILPPTRGRIEQCAAEAGFTDITFFSDFAESPWSSEGAYTIALCRK